MSGRMFKYLISNGSSLRTNVAMREGAVIRAAGMQGQGFVVWAEVPYDVGGEKLVNRIFRVIPTGVDVPDPGTYLGTVFDGPFVWHVYEVPS